MEFLVVQIEVQSQVFTVWVQLHDSNSMKCQNFFE